MRKIDEVTIHIGAQLPGCHLHYNDHTMTVDYIDPLLLMEVARQSTLASAQALGIPKNTILVSKNCDFYMHNALVLRRQFGPVNIVVECVFEWGDIRRRVPRSGICTQRIYLQEELIASYKNSGRILPHQNFSSLRAESRGTPPSWSDTVPDRIENTVLPAKYVARNSILNVVLGKLEIEEDVFRADVMPSFKNRALFDHAYDHLPMQVLIEAARQLSVVVIERTTNSLYSKWGLISAKADYIGFAELDKITTIETCSHNQRDNTIEIHFDILHTGIKVSTVGLIFKCPLDSQ
jgi:hypothetical protein